MQRGTRCESEYNKGNSGGVVLVLTPVHRWYDSFDPSIALRAGRTGKMEEDEDKLNAAVQNARQGSAHRYADLGSNENQCYNRRRDVYRNDCQRTTLERVEREFLQLSELIL
jgi:hypothetical protein